MNRTPMSQSYVNSKANQQQSEAETPMASTSTTSNTQQQQQQQQTPASTSSAGQFSSVGAEIPQLACATELTNLLLEFAYSVFLDKPAKIVDYAANYFNQLKAQRSAANSSGFQVSQPNQSSPLGNITATQQAAGGSKRPSNDSQKSYSGQSNQDDDLGGPSDMEIVQQQRSVNFAPTKSVSENIPVSFNRRKSVFAEQYDPANDSEGDENSVVIHKKTDEQRTRLARAIKSIFIFRSVESQDVHNILNAMFEVKVSPGDVVIKQGDDGDNFYVVERGKFQIYVQREDGSKDIRGEYEDNGSFGELALMYNQPRAATVVALSEGSLWAMDRKTFRRIVLKSAFKKRRAYEALFKKVSLLSCLDDYEKMNLCDALESKRFADGQKIISQGDRADGMYFIESGHTKIIKTLPDGRQVEAATLGKGDYFGELALINHKPRAASVYAMGDDVKLAFLDVKAFERLLGSCIERMEKNCALYMQDHNFEEV